MHYWECDEVLTRFKSFVPLLVLHRKLPEFAMSIPGVSLITASIEKFQFKKPTINFVNRVFRDDGSCLPLQ